MEAINTVPQKLNRKKDSNFIKTWKSNWPFLVMVTPLVLFVILFNYIPMYGIILAFKNFNTSLGLWGSQWVGLENFKYFFQTDDAWVVTRNTVGLNVMFLSVGIIVNIFFAIILFEVKNKKVHKIVQTSTIFPHFLSWVVVSYMAYSFLNSDYGIFNNVLKVLSITKISWYSRAELWPMILLCINLWKGTGFGSLVYYSTLCGIDREQFEAAAIDGANRWHIIRKIYIPHLIPMMTLMLLFSVASIIRADFGLFYIVTRNIPQLYPTTDVIDTYVYRTLTGMGGDIGTASAVSMYQSFVGFALLMITNYFVRKFAPENSLF